MAYQNVFLNIALDNNRISIDLPNDNPAEAKHFTSNTTIKSDTWHILYYRVEEFNPATTTGTENNIYIQIDNQTTETFNYGVGYFYKLDESPVLSNMDRVLSFGNLSNGMRFKGGM